MSDAVGIIATFAWFLCGGISFGALTARDEEPKTWGGAVLTILLGPVFLGYVIGRLWIDGRKAQP